MTRYSEVLDRPVAFHRIFVDVVGTVDGAVLLGQLLYWQRRLSPGREWFWKSDEQWFEELGIKRSALTSARKKLEAMGVIATEVKGFPRRRFYRLDFDALDRQIERVLQARKTPELPLEQPTAPVCRNQQTASAQQSTHCAGQGDGSADKKEKADKKQEDRPVCGNQHTASPQESTNSLQESTNSLQETTDCFIDYNRDYNNPPPAAGEVGAPSVQASTANSEGRALAHHQAKGPMRLDWQPSAMLLERCQLAGIPLDRLGENRLGEILGEFRSYWSTQDLHLNEGEWQHRFLRNLVALKNKNQLYAKPQAATAVRERTLSEDLGDRSWATA
ncbi:MAG: hypothetical protein JKX92_05930 [Porticoccaceae bacterium]|nr:hypothetical protein [Porticoccaceae bacterium]